MSETNVSTRIVRLARMAVLIAVILVMAFTPLGYLRIGTVLITFLVIPVVVGAILEGPAVGGLLGFVFGLTSFFQCFGMDPFGTALMAINPIATAVMCLVPRFFVGFLSGLIFRGLYKADRTKLVSFAVTSVSGALINTVLFVGALILFFGNSEYLRQFGDNVFAILGVLVTINVALEALVCLVAGTAVSKAIWTAMDRQR